MHVVILPFHVKHEAARILPPVDLTVKTRERLERYVSLLRSWSSRQLSRQDLPQLWPRHIHDSLQLVPLLPDTGPLIDLGAGAGLPGLILAIATHRKLHLVEADRRKVAFLREAARVTGANVTIECARIESLTICGARAVTARALGSLDQLLTWSAPLLDASGFCLFPKGRQYETELTQAMLHWHMRVQRWQSRTDSQAVILELSEITRHAGAKR